MYIYRSFRLHAASNPIDGWTFDPMIQGRPNSLHGN